MSQARAEDKQGLDIYCPRVSLSDFSTLPYAAVSQPEWTQHSLPTVLNREGFWVAVQCFLDQRKKNCEVEVIVLQHRATLQFCK